MTSRAGQSLKERPARETYRLGLFQIIPAASPLKIGHGPLSIVGQHGNMTHLAVMAHFGLAIVVHAPLLMLGDQRTGRRHMLAEHIDHDGRLE